MTEIIFDTIDDRSADPIKLLNGLTFGLSKSKYNFKILEHMCRDKHTDYSTYSPYSTKYVMYDSNIIEKLKEIFTNGIFDVTGHMFAQIYLHMLYKPKENFVFFEFCTRSDTVSCQRDIDFGETYYNMHINNPHVNSTFRHEDCLWDHVHLIKTGKKYINGKYEAVFTGLTPTGIYTFTFVEWGIFLRDSCRGWVTEHGGDAVERPTYECKDIRPYGKFDETKTVSQYKKISYIKEICNCFNIGYLDIWTISNGFMEMIMNIDTAKIVITKKPQKI